MWDNATEQNNQNTMSERTNEVYLQMNGVNNEGRSPSKLATEKNKKKLTN